MDLSTLSNEELMRMRAPPSAPPSDSGVDLSKFSNEQLMKMRAGVPTDDAVPILAHGTNPAVIEAGKGALRQLGLTARAGVTGLTAPPAIIGDVLGMDSSGAVQRLMDAAGLPRPQNATERFSQDVAGAMAGGGGQTKLAGSLAEGVVAPVVKRVLSSFGAAPGMQVVASGAGAGAADVAREAGAGPVAQTAAGLAGAAAAPLSQASASAAVRGVLRGGEAGRLRTQGNIAAFEDAGTTPSVGQATENRGARLTETMLSKTPGSAGVMAEKAKTQAAEIGTKVDELATDLSKGATATKAGAAIEKGVKQFVDQFRGQQRFLYDKLDQYIAKDRPVDMTNTANKLAELNADIPGAPELSKFFKNSTIQAIEGAMKSDTQDLTTRLPYEALKKLRTLVGSEMENTSLTSSVPRSKWSALYAAMSDDLGQAAAEAGPEAQKAFQRANTYTRAGHERIGVFLDRVAGKDTVEKIFQAAVNPSEIREGASTVNAVIRSLDEDARNVVRSAFLKRLGVAQAGKQDAAGEVFSPETFLTNWNKISPEAKMTLFADQKGTLHSDLNQVAKAAANLREGSKVFSNPSGTEAALSTRLGMSGILLSGILGHWGIAAGLASGMGGAHVAAKELMTNADFVKWLAGSTKMSTGALSGQLNALEQIASKQPTDVSQAMRDYVEQIRKSAPPAGREPSPVQTQRTGMSQL